MADEKLRAAIAHEAARLMYDRAESEYFTAKRKAAKRLCRGPVKPADLPSNAEIRDRVQAFARMHEGDKRTDNLQAMRVHALRLMRRLCRFRPRLIGSVLTGHTRKGSDIDLHLFSDHIDPITQVLDDDGLQYDIERKTITKHGDTRVFTHVHVHDVYSFELTVYTESQSSYVFKSSITGTAIERASVAELEQLLAREYPDLDIDGTIADHEAAPDPYPLFRLLLLPLDAVKQNPKYHPEGDILYHSLQVFEAARDERPYDEEFLLAALLHDVGKGIDRYDHVTAGLQALDGLLTERCEFLVRHHMDALAYRDGTLGHRARVKLEQHPDFDDLMLLRQCDTAGRVPGAVVGTVDEALAYLRELERTNSGK